MSQSVKNPERLKRVGLITLVVDVILGFLAILFGKAIFGLTIGVSWLIGLVLIGSGLVTFFYMRAVSERDQRTHVE